jgi:ribosome-binding factor A
MANRFEFTRADRIRKAMMREVSDILFTDLKDPRLSDLLISVTDVEVAGDLRHAKIFISVMASPERQQEVLEILREYQPRIRSEIGQRIRLRFTPELDIRYDNSLERGSRITQLLETLSQEETPTTTTENDAPLA